MTRKTKYNPPLTSGKFLGWCWSEWLHQNQWSSLTYSFLYSAAVFWLCWLFMSNSRRRTDT